MVLFVPLLSDPTVLSVVGKLKLQIRSREKKVEVLFNSLRKIQLANLATFPEPPVKYCRQLSGPA